MKSIGDIVDLDVVPFGNGHEQGGKITCQHGPRECLANTLQGCAQHIYPRQTQWFAFILCMERAPEPIAAVTHCAKENGMDPQRLANCAKSEEGREILRTNARRTLTLHPANTHVPWITVNAQPLKDAENVVAAVCAQYQGADKDKYCTEETMRRFDPKAPH